MESRSWRAGAPVPEQQDPEQQVSGLRPDLLLVDEPVQQLVGHSCQGGLWQIQEDGTCKGWRAELDGWTVAPRPATAPYVQVLGRGPAGLTLGKGFLQLQEAPEGEVGQVRAAPDPVLPQVLLQPHPVRCLHPPQLLVLLIHHQLLQLHVHLPPHKPESVSRARGSALRRLAVQGLVGIQQALRDVWRRPRVLEHSGQTLSSEGTGRRSSLGVLSEVGSRGPGTAHNSGSIPQIPDQTLTPFQRHLENLSTKRGARADTWEGQKKKKKKEAFGVIGWVSCLQDC